MSEDLKNLEAESRRMICQIANDSVRETLKCDATESGGVQCELEHSDGHHWISPHTIAHSLSGNGYTCDSFTGEL